MEKSLKYSYRRQNLGNKFSRTLFVIPSGDLRMRSHSVAYRFKAASDFLYLCGVEVSEAYLVVAGQKSYFLSDHISQEVALWEDVNTLMEEDREKLRGIEFASISQLRNILQDHLGNYDRLAFPIGRSELLDRLLLEQVSFQNRRRSRYTNIPLALCDSRTLVGALRHTKDQDEIRLMRTAAQKSSAVYQELFKTRLAGLTEKDVASFLESEFMKQGMHWTAYETIVGSGERGTTLHARATERILRAGEAVLIDAAGEFQGYCADITRVLPIEKSFSKEQRTIYQIVLNAQKEVLKKVRAGETLSSLHETAQQYLVEGLNKEGIKGDITQLMPHSTSHWIGMDVHDPSAYVDESGNAVKLTEGMSFTVEPGLYFRERSSVYYGIGVRIEDDVVVTAEGCEVLSSASKEVEEIESLRPS
ncbi:aminopeptidase P N-terminal domain-containing protein [Bdellovibrio sp. HCB117]|uniref:aminopeptidase P N-terminal domain-containing protein n=1 Tax=Bdellovibrio sp. HCB117 TaxID=3394359 RepID=UPI0039B59412